LHAEAVNFVTLTTICIHNLGKYIHKCSILAGDSRSLTRLLEGLTDLMNENSAAEYNTH